MQQMERDRILNQCSNRVNPISKLNYSSESTGNIILFWLTMFPCNICEFHHPPCVPARTNQPRLKYSFENPLRQPLSEDMVNDSVDKNLYGKSSSSSTSVSSTPQQSKPTQRRGSRLPERRRKPTSGSSAMHAVAPSLILSLPSPTYQRWGPSEAEEHHAELISMVMEELASTEKSYIHALSQFLLLRDQVFAPNWRIDRAKFM